MARYKFASEDKVTVNDIENGLYGIHPGTYMWGEVEKWVAAGNVIEAFETQSEREERLAQEALLLKLESETEEVKAYPKLQAISNMTPAQVGAWVDANVATLAAAKDAIKTLAMAVCVLSKRL